MGITVISMAMLFAAEIENPGTHDVMQPKISVVQGTTDNISVKINESTKVSGIEYDLPYGPQYSPTIAPIDPTTLPDPDDPTSGRRYQFPLKRLNMEKNESGQKREESRWDNDVLVYDGEVGEGQDFDVDPSTGDIYVIFDTYHTSQDSLVVYRSTDGGNSFQWWRASYNGDGEIGNPKIRIAQDAGGQTWVCMFGIWHEPSGDDVLYMRRMTPDQSQGYWEEVNSNVVYADVDADVGTGAWVYVTYIPEGTDNDIWAARNNLDGTGWQDNQQLFADPGVTPYPQIAAGSGGNVAVAFIDDRITTNNEVRIKRSTNYGSTWISSEQVSNNSGAYPIRETDIAYSYSASYETGWITATFYVVDNDNLVYYWSTDAGVNWTYGGLIGSSSNDENLSSIRARKATGSLTVAYNQDPGDSTMFTWTTASNPTNFITPYRINDYNATGIWAPTAGWISSYSAICYSSYTMGYNLFFDWFNNTGVAELPDEQTGAGVINLAPNPSSRVTRLTYAINNETDVRITLYDATGRLVKNILQKTQAPGEYTLNIRTDEMASGIYIIKIQTAEHTITRTMTVVR